MQQKQKTNSDRFIGFLETPSLWENDKVYGLKQFKSTFKNSNFNSVINEKLRLGKYIERLVSYELSQDNTVKIISENLQILKDNKTLGELDCLLEKEKQVLHLEIIYKFYLYDSTIGSNEIEHFIGPNKNDSLIQKLNKLKNKQLPILYSEACKPYLDALQLKSCKIQQQVYFKAQLFIPFYMKNIKLNLLNNKCIIGFYISKSELHLLKKAKFFVPNKKDWLIVPHKNVNWINFEVFKIKTNQFLERKFSPLFWLKNSNGLISKGIVVWW